jgi:ribosome production factor 2
MGRIHMGKQDLANLQSRKMKGLKRTRGDVDVDAETLVGEDEIEVPSKKSR